MCRQAVNVFFEPQITQMKADLIRFSGGICGSLVSSNEQFGLMDHEFNYSHLFFVKMGSVIP